MSTVKMPTKDFARGLVYILFSMSKPNVAEVPNRDGLRPGVLVHVKNFLLRGYNGAQNTVHYITRRSARTATQGKPVVLELQSVNNQATAPATAPAGEPESTPEPPSGTHSSSFASVAGDPEQAHQPATGGKQSSVEAPPTRFHHTRKWVPLLIVGVLCLIVVPSLVLGIVRGQLLWGIALSGTIATVASLIAGLYYYLNK